MREFPAVPELAGAVCNDKLCFTIEEITALGSYQASILEVQSSLKGCSLLEWRK